MKKTRYPFLLACFSFLFLTTNTLYAQSLEQKSKQYLVDKQKDWQATPEDFSDLRLLSQLTDEHNGVTHLYFVQQAQGIAIKGTALNFSFDRTGKMVQAGGAPIGGLSQKVNAWSPQVSAVQAIRLAAQEHGISTPVVLQVVREATGPTLRQVINPNGFALDSVTAQLNFFPEKETITLAWEVWIYTLDASHLWQVWVDALTGKVLESADHVVSCSFGESNHLEVFDHQHHGPVAQLMPSPQARPMAIPQYRVYPLPLESPLFGPRSLLVDPSDATASPFGWHDTNGVTGEEYTYARGNNVYAYTDLLNNNTASPANSADGGATLNFDFALDLALAPSTYRPAAVTNLFYMNNMMHDVLYQYGFNEASGNFQSNNYGKGGTASDEVNGEAQDGGGVDNANFATQIDGNKPRMQMYIWTTSIPNRDGDLDNGIVAHEYGHGVSNRLTGGRNNTSCLQNTEQMGEGWSDYLALMLTMKPTDTGTKSRGIGNYALNQDSTAVGIRTYPYTTDIAVNPHTYNSIKTAVVPHGLGSVWCEMLWEMTWALIDVYGLDPDIYNGTGGNNIALQLVMDGMKLQPCSPGFVDGRNAILKADTLNNGAANSCLIWKAFAKRGLGLSASQGSSGSKTDGVEAYDYPPVCDQTLKVYLTATPDPVAAGQVLTYSIKAKNQKTSSLTGVVLSETLPSGVVYVNGSASNGGSSDGTTVSFPGVALAAGDSAVRTFEVQVNNAPYSIDFVNDPAETNTNWTLTNAGGTTNWALASSPAPHQGTNSWFCVDASTITDVRLELTTSIVPVAGTILSFWHKYAFESSYDGGVVELSTNGGSSWQDLEIRMINAAYDANLSTLYGNPLAGRRAFTGNQISYSQVLIDLSPFAGQNVKIRFRVGSDSSVGSTGWNVDDIVISKSVYIPATACATALEGDIACISLSGNGTMVTAPTGTLPVEGLNLVAFPADDQIELTWSTTREMQNAGFGVERLSPQGVDFEKMGFVKGAGTTFSPRNYHFADEAAKPGVVYRYRLSQLDIDGFVHYSNLVEAALPLSDPGIALVPNPAQDLVLIRVAEVGKQVTVSLTDQQGKVILSFKPEAQQLVKGWELSISEVAAGLYYLQIEDGLNSRTAKLSIVR